MSKVKTILVTGASGYLGGLVAAQLLSRSDARLIFLVRDKHNPEALLADIRAKAVRLGFAPDPNKGRVVFCSFSDVSKPEGLFAAMLEHQVDEVIHLAACIDFLNEELLRKVNVGFTQSLLEMSQRADVERFVYVSSAFSSGYVTGKVPETLHPEPLSDPTFYTRSKRMAETLVAQSGIPYLIVRPSLVIGNSRDGAYEGQAFGIYQVMQVYQRLLCEEYVPILHAVAPKMPLQVLHEDSFVEGFFASYSSLPDGSVIHLVSRSETLPTFRDLWELWVELCVGSEEVHYYPNIEGVPLSRIDPRQRTLMEFSQINIEIGAHRWDFESQKLEALRGAGLRFVDATRASTRVCIERFIRDSSKIQKFLQANRQRFALYPRVVEEQSERPRKIG